MLVLAVLYTGRHAVIVLAHANFVCMFERLASMVNKLLLIAKNILNKEIRLT